MFGRRLVAIALGPIVWVAGCNLVFGIDEQDARPTPDDDAPNRADAQVADGGADGDTGPPGPTDRCSRDSDCVAPNGCYTPHCDTVLGACTYALCEAKGMTCAAGICDPKKLTCSAPQPYGFIATRYDVGGVTSGCGPNPNDCVAAAFPFVFVGTNDGLAAVRGDDFVARAGITVPVVGVTVPPARVISSARRIWVLGAVQGTSPPYKLAIAMLDVPSDPTVSQLHAQTVVVSYPFPTVTAFAAPAGALFLVDNDPAVGLPTALLTTLPPDGASLVDTTMPGDAGAKPIAMFRAAGVPAGASVVASSGSRLVLFRPVQQLNLVSAPGTKDAKTAGDTNATPALVMIGPTTFSQGPDGTILGGGAVNADSDCNCNSHARFEWIFPNAVATAPDVNAFFDTEGYGNPQILLMGCHVCTGDYYRPRVLTTWIDHRTVVSAAPNGGDVNARMVTDLRAFGRDPYEANLKRRAQTKATDTPKGDFLTDRIALTSANGIAYLVLADSQGNDVSLSVVDPRCDAK